MPPTMLGTTILWGSLALTGWADDPPQLPKGSPPRLISVIKVEGDILSYRDYSFMPLMPKQAGRLQAGELVPCRPSAGSMFAGLVEFSFKDGTLLDAEGREIAPTEARKRLRPGDTAMVSTSGRTVDPIYLRILRKETLILVHPVAPPGPPLPGGNQ